MTASLPEYKLISGDLWKFKISDAPYPTPPLVKSTDVISPLNIGWTSASKVFPAIDDIPTLPITSTEIGW